MFPDLQPGDVLGGRYVVRRSLGRGGMGVVVAAYHEGLGREVAVKVLGHAGAAAAVDRMRREARTVARLSGENVVRVLDTGEDDGRPFFVMELIPGRTLREVLAEERRLQPTRAVRLAGDVAIALAEAHALGIVHRDVKPSNLFVSRRADGTEIARVVDFGIARALDASTLTATEGALGTPQYAAPEQLRDAHSAGPAADVWSLGVVLYEMLTGALPYEASSAAGFVARISSEPPVPIRRRGIDLPSGLADVVDRCLSRAPADRYATAVDMAEALAPFAGEESLARARRARATAEHVGTHPDEAPPRVAAANEVTATATKAPWTAVTAARSPSPGRGWVFAGGLVALGMGALAVAAASRGGATLPTPGPAGSAVAPSASASQAASEAVPRAASERAPDPPPPVTSTRAEPKPAPDPARPGRPVSTEKVAAAAASTAAPPLPAFTKAADGVTEWGGRR